MMKKTIRKNTHAAYSLHDMNILSVDVVGNDIILRTQSGLVETEFPYGQPDGYVEFHNVRWDYSYAYLLAFSGNSGTFSGEKLFLKDFLSFYMKHSSYIFIVPKTVLGTLSSFPFGIQDSMSLV